MKGNMGSFMVRVMSWSVVTIVSVLIAFYAIGLSFIPGFRTYFVQQLYDLRPLSIILHMGFGGLALLVSIPQLSRRLRRGSPQYHRYAGRVYGMSVLISGGAGLYLAVHAQGGYAGRFGFGLLAVTWLLTTIVAWTKIRQRDVVGHQVWMTRSFALTLAAVTLRIFLPIGLVSGLSFKEIYPAVAWLSWVPNLIIAEWFFVSRLNKKT